MKLKWTSNVIGDDLSCNYVGYRLRVEKMAKDSWWWCVYDSQGKQIAVDLDEGSARSRREAKLYCENHLFRALLNEKLLTDD